MKNLYTLAVGVLLSTNLIAQNGNFVNGGFENWTDVTLYDFPTEWKNSNQQEYRGGTAIAKSTDASDGTFSIEVGAYIANSEDTLSGYVFHGELDQSGPSAGIPYLSTFDEVRFDRKSDLQLGDSAFLIVIRSTAGTMDPMEIYPVAFGTESNWTQTTVSINAGTQDSLFLGFTLGSPTANFPSNPSSWVRIDNVKMYNGGTEITNIPDPSFEDWSVQTTEEPDAWYTANAIMVPIGGSNVVKSTDANTGMYSAQMTTVFEPQNGDTISAFLSNAPINYLGSVPFQGAPYVVTPDSIRGVYKYAGNNGDIGLLIVKFFSANVLLDSVGTVFTDQSSWQSFEIPFSLASAPDSMSFLAYSGEHPGSVLKLDDLELFGGNVSLNEFETMNVSMYPNPATSTVMIKAEGNYDYEIVDLAGNLVMSSRNANGAIQLDISGLSSGAYVVKINNATAAKTLKLIIE